MLGSLRDLAPIILVIFVFQVFVLQKPFPNLEEIIPGLILVVIGLTFFVQGLELGLFPLGEDMAQAFAKKGNLTALLSFAFCLGFGTTAAEPALIAVAKEAAEAADMRHSQVRSLDRSERIRTYNFPENRIVDHRTNYKAYNLDAVLDGDLQAVIDSDIQADEADRLANQK